MRLALAQVNPIVGDLEGNVARCLEAVETARVAKPDLVVLPEMAVPGYPPRDILYDSSFVEAVDAATQDLARRTAGGPPVAVGTLVPSGKTPPEHPGLYNVVVLLDGGEVKLAAVKRLLPIYDVFHEPRWFLPGPAMPPVSVAGKQVGFLVCEDMWDEGYNVHPAADLLAAGAELLVCIAATPYRHAVLEDRLYHARRHGAPLVHLNLCGANDELIFDGSSFVISGEGELLAQLPSFETAVHVFDLETATPIEPQAVDAQEELFQALVLGVRDFVHKNRLERVFLGLSGGIDSALVAVIAAEAVGPGNVTAVAIPSRYTDPRSTSCARELAETLGINFEVVELEELHAAAEAALGDLLEVGTAAENVQARLRAMILMGFVNSRGGMLLNTSNKTELTLGYGTLYGDLAGTLGPIADLTKPEVVALAHWLDAHHAPIPRFTLERPPSAELKPDQVDPFDYPKISPELESLVQENRSNQAMRSSEHKRRQMGVTLRVSKKAFGPGRLMPITRR